jgi:hypothetical protein
MQAQFCKTAEKIKNVTGPALLNVTTITVSAPIALAIFIAIMPMGAGAVRTIALIVSGMLS